jgi:hypothetical protein
MPDRIEDLPLSEPYLRLARRGAEAWNRWVRTGMDVPEMAKEYGLDEVKPLDADEARELAALLGLDRLPGFNRPPNFENVDFTEGGNDQIDFSGFVFAPDRLFLSKRGNADGQVMGQESRASALLCGASFGDDVRFDQVTFGPYTRFDRATFGRGASFNGARIGEWTSFAGATFGEWSVFAGASFGRLTSFDGTTFGNGANFSGVTFGVDTSFANATFGHYTRFDGWETSELEEVLRQLFKRWGWADSAIVKPVKRRLAASRPNKFEAISFADALFDGYCSFHNRGFERPADFSGAVFLAVPDFGGAGGFEHLDLSEIEISCRGGWSFLRNWTTSSEIERRLRHFRKIAKDAEAHDLERNLFILERKAQRGIQFARLFRRIDFKRLKDSLRGRNPLRPLGLTLLLFLYRAASDYGHSMVRPLLWFAASLAGFHAGYWWLYRAALDRTHPFLHPDLVSFTLGNALPFASGLNPARRDVLLRLFKSASDAAQIHIPTSFELLSIAQSLIGAALLFLFLLAIRNRFKLG